jgi:adenylate cyclase
MRITSVSSPLATIEPRLRNLLPADLYASVWLDPSPASLMRVFEHLRTLQRILSDYIARQVLDSLPQPGEVRYEWQEGTLMFTDLAGFTPLLEANADKGAEGAKDLLHVLNAYFSSMIEIISKSGGNILEFTGDAMLAQWEKGKKDSGAGQAVRAGLRMQRAMANFQKIKTGDEELSFGMRIGIHSGRFLTADIGTPRRMDHVLLGSAVRAAKRAEGAGSVGRVCLTESFVEGVKKDYRLEPTKEDHSLVIDDLTADQLGDFELTSFKRSRTSNPLFERTAEALLTSIAEMLDKVEAMASYLPTSILNLLVENTTRREIPPDFPIGTVIFVNLIGVSELADEVPPGAEMELITGFSRAFTLIDAVVEARGGLLKKVTYHLSGSDIMILFGVPQAHTDDVIRAADAAVAIRDIVLNLKLPEIAGKHLVASCKIGVATGQVFSGEIGEPRGRREFNALGDTVNTAARLMSKAEVNEILITGKVHDGIAHTFECEVHEPLALKGKAKPTVIYGLKRHK